MENKPALSNLSPDVVSKLDIVKAAIEQSTVDLRLVPIAVENPSGRVKLVTQIRERKELLKWIDGERMAITRQLDARKKEVMAVFDGLVKPLVTEMLPRENAVKQYDRLVMQQRQSEIADRETINNFASVEKGTGNRQDGWLVAEIVPEVATTVRPANVAMVWTAELDDEPSVPREYMTVDMVKVRKAVRDGVRQIPGIIIGQVAQTRF